MSTEIEGKRHLHGNGNRRCPGAAQAMSRTGAAGRFPWGNGATAPLARSIHAPTVRPGGGHSTPIRDRPGVERPHQGSAADQGVMATFSTPSR
jgi:hypothetical protein